MIFFYYRIFPTDITRLSCYVIGGVCAAWYIALVIVGFTSCIPLDSTWNPTVTGHCIDSLAFSLSTTAINFIIDAATVSLPVYEVVKLQMSRRRKYTIIGIFVIGGA